MNTTQAQQKALGDAFVAPTDYLEFGKCNKRLKTNIKPKEATFQVVLDALALTPFYQAFLITAEVPAIYMQEFWAIVFVHKDLGYTGDITYLTDVNVDYLHQPWRAFSTIINKCLSGKETGIDKILYMKILKCMVPFSKGTNKPSNVGIQSLQDILCFCFWKENSKTKQPAKKPKAKGLAVLSEVVLTEAEQLSWIPKEARYNLHKNHTCEVNRKTKPWVPIYEGDDEMMVILSILMNDNDDANDEQEGDDTNDDDEDTDRVRKKDVKVNLGNEDTEMTNADQGASEQQNVSQESGFEQVEEDAHLLNLENPSPADNEIASLMETSSHHATAVPEITSSFTTTIPPPPPFF
ncbi:hypothetical protein Tco_1144997 [Tanacetum coccineum]